MRPSLLSSVAALALIPLLAHAGGPIGLSIGTAAGQARDAAAAITAETSASSAASTASTNASNAVTTANTASTNASTALSRVPNASTTFTPTIQIGGSNATATYTKQYGAYTQNGAEVAFEIEVDWSALTTGAGAVTIPGLPAPKSGNPSPQLMVAGFGVITSPVTYATISSSGAIALMQANNSQAASSDTALPGTGLGSTGQIHVRGSYLAN